MCVITNTQFVKPNPHFRDSWVASWVTIFSDGLENTKVLITCVKPTKKQVRKLRRQFRKSL